MGLFDYDSKEVNRKIRKFNDLTKRRILNLELCQVNYKIKKLQSVNQDIENKLRHLPRHI